jgi:hypothetical protein
MYKMSDSSISRIIGYIVGGLTVLVVLFAISAIICMFTDNKEGGLCDMMGKLLGGKDTTKTNGGRRRRPSHIKKKRR